jgi:hypothetical protein
VEAEFFALLDARDKTAAALEKLKKESTETQETALTRALALEAANGVVPDHFVQVLRQLDALSTLREERILALKEFLRRFWALLKDFREKHRAEIETALLARIAKLEEQKKLPGAPVEAIEAEIARLKRELACIKTGYPGYPSKQPSRKGRAESS